MSIDELSSGPEGPSRPWVIAVIAGAVLLAGLALFHLTNGHAKADKAPRVPQPTRPTASYESTPPAPSLRPPTQPAPSHGPIGIHAAPPIGSPAFVPSKLDGVQSAIPKGVRLLLGGQHPTELGGNPRQFSQVPVHANQAVSGIDTVRDGFVVEVDDYAATGHALTAYWVRPDGRAGLVTKTDVVIPAQSGDRIFGYQTGPSTVVPLAKRIGRLVEVTLTGHVIATHTLPPGLVPLADSPAGLVFSDLAKGTVEVRDRRTLVVRKDIARTENHISVDHGWLVASDDPFCTVSCRLTLQNLATAKSFRVAIPDDRYVGAVAVNPNGSSAAISYWGAETPGSVVVADLASGTSKQVPGVVIESRRVADIAWTPDGRTLAVSVTDSQHDVRRIALSPAGGGNLQVLAGTQPGASKPWSLGTF